MARIFDGSGTTISVSTATMYVTGITPPSFEGGGEIDTTTLANSAVRTRRPKILKDVGECSFTAQYDPGAIGTLYSLVNDDPNEITITFKTGETIVFYGWIDSVSVGEVVEGEAPTIDVTVIASNCDNSDPPAEKVPTFG
tara:strand:- start:19080 stop:19499 length:420 start_codon:yes stop_codon:yes gene_type:complete